MEERNTLAAERVEVNKKMPVWYTNHLVDGAECIPH